jgi:hypothetical protein
MEVTYQGRPVGIVVCQLTTAGGQRYAGVIQADPLILVTNDMLAAALHYLDSKDMVSTAKLSTTGALRILDLEAKVIEFGAPETYRYRWCADVPLLRAAVYERAGAGWNRRSLTAAKDEG